MTNNRAPGAALPLVALVPDALELLEVVLDQRTELAAERVAGAINSRGVADPNGRIGGGCVPAWGWNICEESWEQSGRKHWPQSPSCGRGSHLQEPTTKYCRML